MSPATLHVQLECELPPELSVGRGTALFVCGWCFSAQAKIRSLSFLLDGEPQPVAAHGMPRLDPFRALHPDLDPFAADGGSVDHGSQDDPHLRSYRSGFWGIVRIASAPVQHAWRLALRAELEGGVQAVAELARIRPARAVQPLVVTWPPGAGGPRVAISMATYNPPAALLRTQLDSIRGQTHGNWICIVSDDCSNSESDGAIRGAIDGDPRFLLSRSPARLGFYRNFERALALAPADAQFVAMADQDDSWHPDKLDRLLAAIGSAQLVYSDARVVSRDGELISETWWDQRRNNHSDLLSLLVANAVTGAASLLRRDLLEYALPFPPAQFAHFHDHWVGLTALALGDIAFVERPLYDYVQHGDASLGHAAANQMTSLRDRLTHQRPPAERVRQWRLHYFVDVCRLLQFAAVLDMRCSERMSPSKRRALHRFVRADRSVLPLLRLGIRGACELLRGTPETLGAEWMLLHAFAWRRLLAASARDVPQRRLRLDALPPPSLVQQPGRTGLHESARALADKIAPLRWALSGAAPQRINLLIPTIDLQHFFGGYIAKFNLARRLVEQGFRVRIVTVDPLGPLPGDWRRTLQSFAGLEGLLDRVEIAFGRESAGIETSACDHFIATTWWTAHIARDALRSVDDERFVYLIQEYEPFTFPMGTFAALAQESYGFPHVALFSSDLLRGYFEAHRIGVYAAGPDAGDGACVSFENAITPVPAPSAEELAARGTRRLLFYARPEPHAARNMFELGVLALSRALADGLFQGGWELNGIGTVQPGRRISLGGGSNLNLLPRSDQQSYARLLREHDVGLALMYTPHPSLVPIEMASGGMMTVTNRFENKTPQAMAAISANLIAAEPTVEGVAEGLREAAAGVPDFSARARGSHVKWSRSWDQSFPAEALERLVSTLGRAGVGAV